jgi:RimJ/RimL family protein N-acetyltransferase
MHFETRQIQESDIPGYHACLDSVAQERRYLAMQEAPPLDASASWVRSHISHNHPLHIIHMEGHVVGWCDVTPLPRHGFKHRAELGIGLLADFRGRGLGTQLIQSAIEHAKQIELIRIELDVRESNSAAINLYHKVGFSIEGTIKKGIQINSGYENILLMALLLNE